MTSVKSSVKQQSKTPKMAVPVKKRKKSAPKKFTLDCSRPQEDGIFNAGDFVSSLCFEFKCEVEMCYQYSFIFIAYLSGEVST